MPNILKFHFEGTGKLTPSPDSDSDEGTNERIDEKEFIKQLNYKSWTIAELIASEIKDQLPNGITPTVSIRFNPGSIEWFGVVELIDWAARSVRDVVFASACTAAIKYAVNIAMAKSGNDYHVPDAYLIEDSQTRVEQIPDQPHILQFSHSGLGRYMNDSLVIGAIILNCALTFLILLLILIRPLTNTGNLQP